MEGDALHADGGAVGGHPGLEISDVGFQFRVGGDKGVTLIADPEIRGEAADVLAHLEDTLFDLERGALAVYLIHPAHLLGQAEELTVFGEVGFNIRIHAARQRFQAVGGGDGDGPLEGGHAVEEGLGRAEGLAGVGGIVIHQIVPAKVIPACLAEDGHEGAEGLDAQRQGRVQQALFLQPQADAAGRLLHGLGDVLLHIVGDVALRVLGQNLFDVVGRLDGQGLAGKVGAIPQVAVQLEHQRHQLAAAPAVGEEVEPIEIDVVALAAAGQLVVVVIAQNVGLGVADADDEGRVVGLDAAVPLVPDHLLEEVARQRACFVKGPLQQLRVHFVFPRQGVAAEHGVLPVIVHDALKNIALGGFHGPLPRIGGQIIGQIADGDKVAQLLLGDAQAEGLFQIGHDGEDLHGGEVQIVHQDAVFIDVFGGNFRHVLQNSQDLRHDFRSFHNDKLPFRFGSVWG